MNRLQQFTTTDYTTIAFSDLPLVCVVGLGYIGLPTAAVLANHGYRVHGFEKNSLMQDRPFGPFSQRQSDDIQPGGELVVHRGDHRVILSLGQVSRTELIEMLRGEF